MAIGEYILHWSLLYFYFPVAQWWRKLNKCCPGANQTTPWMCWTSPKCERANMRSPARPSRNRVQSSNRLDVILTLLHGGKLITLSQHCVCVCVTAHFDEGGITLGHSCDTHTHMHRHTLTHSHTQRGSWHCCCDRCSWLVLASVTTALYDTLPQWRASYGAPVNMG